MGVKKTSFKAKVLIPIITIFVITVLTISAINYRLLNLTVKTKTNANLELFINNILAQEQHLKTILDATTDTINSKNIAIAKSVAYILENSSADKTVSEYQRIVELLGSIELNIVDGSGTIVNGNIDDYKGFDYRSSEPTKAYMGLVEGTISEYGEKPRKDALSGNITHYSGVSRTDAAGFVQVGFDANILGKIEETMNIRVSIESTKIGDNGYGIVLADGTVIAHPRSDMLGKDVTGEEWFGTVNEGDGYAWLNIDGDKYYAGYKNTDGHTVIGLVPDTDYYKELNQVLTNTILIISLALIIMIAVVYIVVGGLLTPIKTVSESLGEIAKGDFDTRIEGEYNDEFAIIKEAVNSMATGIQAHLNDKLQAEQTAHESELAKGRAEAAREAILDSINYASRIQRSLLPSDSTFESVFADYSIIWKPRDIVGGDIYWIKSFEKGTVLCVCDCTGHGTPGALLTMVVVSTFEMTVNETNCENTGQIVWELENRLVSILNVETSENIDQSLKRKQIIDIHDGCDLAVLFIAKDGSVNISAGNTHVFVCDGTAVTQYRGQKIRVGDGMIKSLDEINVAQLPANPDNKFYIASDGLYEQLGGENSRPFGYSTFKNIILEKHNERLSVISDEIWHAFEDYRGENSQVDDFELITFRPTITESVKYSTNAPADGFSSCAETEEKNDS